MEYPSNPPHSYRSYPSSSDTLGNESTNSTKGGVVSASDYSTDGYSPATNDSYLESVPYQSQVQRVSPATQQPYVAHQQFHPTSPFILPPGVAYGHPDTMYAAAPELQQQSIHPIDQHGEQQQPIPTPTASILLPEIAPSTSAHDQYMVDQQEQQHQPQQSSPYQRIARFAGAPPVALACTECRARHLKCNAGVPACSRCLVDRRECAYIKSRRGWKGTKRKKAAAAAAAAAAEKECPAPPISGPGTNNNNALPTAPPPPPGSTCSVYSQSASTSSKSSPPPVNQTSPGPSTNPMETLRSHYNHSTLFRSPQESQAPVLSANLLQLYYAYFHSAHPLCLPLKFFLEIPAQHRNFVLPVMRFVGSFFARTAPTERFREEAERVLFTANSPPPRNAFTVQALTLFAIGLHSDNDQVRCAEVKDVAIEMALNLRMNHREFSDNSGTGRVLAECWRRTWWELYFLDGLLAGFHQKDHFKLWSVPCTVPLPCEEQDYSRGAIPESRTLEEFDERFFAKDVVVFSSFAYRVEAVRILGLVLAVGQDNNPEDPMADAADNSLVNWGLHLPDCKKELVGPDRRVDEMLFQAHMVINAATIYLHRPKSSLASSSTLSTDTSCTPESKYMTATKPIALHTAKALHAANTISKLITLPCPLIKHTPFFTCVVTLGAIVHLSACSWLLQGDEGFMAKERIRLGVGALKTLEEVWNVASCVLLQVKGVAREVFALKIPEGATPTGIITEGEFNGYIDDERTLEIVGGDADYHGLPELNWDGES